MALAWNAGLLERVSRVRIPLPPPIQEPVIYGGFLNWLNSEVFEPDRVRTASGCSQGDLHLKAVLSQQKSRGRAGVTESLSLRQEKQSTFVGCFSC